MSKERKIGISPENLDKHAVNAILAPVAGTRFNVCDVAIRSAMAAIGREKPYIPAEIRIANSMPTTEAVAAEPQAAAAMAVSAAAEVTPVDNPAVDPGDYLAVGELAHTAHNPNASDDQSMAARVLAAWRRDGPKHRKAIDPRDLRHEPAAETPTLAQEQQYVSGLSAAVQSPSHLPAFYDNVDRTPTQPELIQSAQDDVVRAFPMPADSMAAGLRPTHAEDMPYLKDAA